MKQFALILLSAASLFSFKEIKNKVIIGHWTNENDLYDLKINDTLIFTKIKYSAKLYQWGGALSGIDISKDNHFLEYHNILCSSETDPVRYYNETWKLNNDTLLINSPERNMEWKVISTNNKSLKIIVLKINVN